MQQFLVQCHTNDGGFLLSKLLMSLVEQKYRDKLRASRDDVLRSLRREVSGCNVEFMWAGREDRSASHRLAGIVSSAGFDKNDEVMVVIKFTNPEYNRQETVTRYVKELLR